MLARLYTINSSRCVVYRSCLLEVAERPCVVHDNGSLECPTCGGFFLGECRNDRLVLGKTKTFDEVFRCNIWLWALIKREHWKEKKMYRFVCGHHEIRPARIASNAACLANSSHMDPPTGKMRKLFLSHTGRVRTFSQIQTQVFKVLG